MSVAQIATQIKGLYYPNFVSVISLEELGKMAYDRWMVPDRNWPSAMVQGWAACEVRFSEEALATTGWREDVDVDVFEPEI